MTIKKERKERENKPNNFNWDEIHSTLVFCCYRAEANLLVRTEIANKLKISEAALTSKIREYQTIEHYPERSVPKKAQHIYEKNSFRSKEECELKVKDFLENDNFVSEVLSADSKIEIPIVETKAAITALINQGVVDLGNKYLNSKNLVVLKDEKSLNFIERMSEGCYFIFSTLPLEMVPVMSENGDKNYLNSYLIKDGEKFHCLYNGKSNSVHERLKVHLFNSHTLEKVKAGKADTISGTGAMSLVSLPEEDFIKLQAEGKFDPSKHKLKPVEKSVQECSLDKREGHKYFLNGIDITEAPWNQYKFAVIVLRSDSEFGKILIEEAYCVKNGRPPLCKRHG